MEENILLVNSPSHSQHRDDDSVNSVLSQPQHNASESEKKCRFCERKFANITRRKLHESKAHHGELTLLYAGNGIQCGICLKKYKNSKTLTKHLRNCLPSNDGIPYDCAYCDKSFTIRWKYREHLQTHSNLRPFLCTECGKSFTAKGNLREHLRIHTGLKAYKCKYCEKAFTLSSQRKVHERTHTDERPFKCPTCSKSFNSYNSLQVCLQKHDDVRVPCPICGKKLRERYLTRHQRNIHGGEKRYKCEECSKSYFARNSLEKHRLLHTGELPYACKECNCAYSDLTSFKRHILKHSGEMEFYCVECKKSFASYSGYQQHLSTIHAANRKSCCGFCGDFVNKESLKRHQRRCQKIATKNYVCRFCDSAYFERIQLNRHLIKEHGAPKVSEVCPHCDKVYEWGKLSHHLFRLRHFGSKSSKN